MLTKFLLSLSFAIIFSSICYSDEHWAIGGWDCRHWGSVKISKHEKYGNCAVDIDPQGELQDYGFWQDYDQHSIVILWQDSYRIEIINKHYDKFYRQVMIEGFGIVSDVEEVKKIHNGE